MTAATGATTTAPADQIGDVLVDQGEIPRQRTTSLLNAMGITRVIWVDDQHVVDDGTSSLDQVRDALFFPQVLQGIWACLDLAKIAIPVSTNRTSAEEARELLDARWTDFENELQVQITQVVRAAASLSDQHPDLQVEQRTSELEAISIPDLFVIEGVTFLPLSLAEWRAQGAVLLDSDEPTMLLIDRDFSDEGGSATGGEQVLADVLKDPRAKNFTAALFSHTLESEDAERALAIDLAHRYELEVTRVTTIGKYRSGLALPEALRVLLLAKELEEYRALILRALDEANVAARAKIESLHRYTLLGSIAAASDEGAYELDMPIRIAMNAYRPKVLRILRDRIASPPLLERFRDTATREAYLFAGTENPQIRSVLREDIFDDPQSLSELHLPIEVGDIFKTYPVGPEAVSRKARYWVLLGQACDLSIRRVGERANNVEALTLTQLRPQASSALIPRSLDAQRMHPVGQFDVNDDQVWFINAAEQIIVPAAAIDATVFGPDGRAVLPCPEPTVPVSEGWSKRREALNKFGTNWIEDYAASTQLLSPPAAGASAKRYQRTLAMIANSIAGAPSYLKHGVMVEMNADVRTVEYGLRRAGRISAHKATYLLNLAVGYHGRPADNADTVIERPRAR